MASSSSHSTAPAPSHPAHTLLARAHSPTTATQLFADKLAHNKPLLLRPSSPPAPADKRALRRYIRLKKKEYYLRKQKPRPLSAKAKRELGVHDIPKSGSVKYEVYKGLNRLWAAYMREVLGLDGKNRNGNSVKRITAAGHGSLLASADFHGAELEVVRSGCVGRVGTHGIVVRDTKFTFVLVCPDDKVRRVPKRGCVFRVVLRLSDEGGEEGDGKDGSGGDKEEKQEPGADGTDEKETTKRNEIVFEINGSQFEVRPAERANKKFKWNFKDFL